MSVVVQVAGGWQVNTFFSYASGRWYRHRQHQSVQHAERADPVCRQGERRPGGNLGDVVPTAEYFDVSAYRPTGRRARFGNSGHGAWRGPSAPNVDMSFSRVFRIGQNKTLQVRAEVFNISNTPHFGNPTTNISNVTFNPWQHPGVERRWRHHVDRPHRPQYRRARMALRRRFGF